MGWGWRITILYSAFVVFMIGLVILAVKQDFHLVADDYYAQELAYQDRIDQMTNAQEDGQHFLLESNADNYRIAFQQQVSDVNVQFFRPSDDEGDVTLEESGLIDAVNVKGERLMRGRYLVKAAWTANGKRYYQETPLFVQ